MPRIFIVDDSISVRKALEITFKRHGLDSVSAVSAEQALEILQSTSSRMDLLMADVIMPGMSGLELCVELRSQTRFHSLPIILMSGNIDDDLKQRADEVGADGVLRKPFSPDELIPMVEGLLSRTVQANAEGGSPATPVAHAVVNQAAPQTPALPAATTTDPMPASVPVAVSTAPQATPHQAHVPLGQLVREYEAQPETKQVMVLDQANQITYRSIRGNVENLPVYARYFTNTARVIGQQLLSDELQGVILHYQGHQALFRPVEQHLLIVIRGVEHPIR